ncbi:hypothetical protein RJ641_009868 [Dillenia turbinata]|uniref:Uncharacterized protein n=1 Tax=Dillenia turbinata TaxID=194707 RepID=A0AAN8V9G2_9MAGN
MFPHRRRYQWQSKKQNHSKMTPDTDTFMTESNNLKQLIQHALNNHEFAPQQSLAKQETLEQPNNAEEEKVLETKEVESLDLTEEDGAKTIEAIKETVVAVFSSAETSTKAESNGSWKEQVFTWGNDAFTMLKNTIQWRKEFGIDELYEQNLVDMEGLEKAVFLHGCCREGHPVCYNVYGQFKEKELYH